MNPAISSKDSKAKAEQFLILIPPREGELIRDESFFTSSLYNAYAKFTETTSRMNCQSLRR
jgi:hypothetical protein